MDGTERKTEREKERERERQIREEGRVQATRTCLNCDSTFAVRLLIPIDLARW